MLKIYAYRGRTYQFEEGEQPAGAVEVVKETVKPSEKAEEPENKSVKPANKRRAVKTK